MCVCVCVCVCVCGCYVLYMCVCVVCVYDKIRKKKVRDRGYVKSDIHKKRNQLRKIRKKKKIT